MNRYTRFTSKEKDDDGWYKCKIMLVFPKQTFKCNTYPFYKPNRKGKPKAKRNKLFNNSMRSIYGKKWPDVKKILKNTTKIEIKDIRGIKDSQHLVELFLSPTPIMEFASGDLQL